MLRKIKIGKNEIHLFKRDDFIEEGEYYILPSYTKNRQIDKLLGVIHSSWNGYTRLLQIPLSSRSRTILGFSHAEKAKFKTEKIEISKNDRVWQKRVFNEVNEARSRNEKFRAQINAGLGAGKTYLALKICASGSNPVVFCPPSIWSVWKEEAEKFEIECPELSTYESAKKLDPEGYDIVILDEVLKVKNPCTNRTREIRNVCENAEIVIGLTGTPMAGKDYLDLRSINTVGCGEFLPENDQEFIYTLAKTLVTVEHKKDEKHDEVWEWNTDVINILTSPVMRTIEISDLMKEIPEKEYEKVVCSTPKGFYEILGGLGSENKHQAVSRARECTDGFVYEKDFSGNRKVKKLADIPKMKELVNQVSKFQGMIPTEKVVIWVNFQASQKMVSEVLIEKGFKVSILFSDQNEKEMEQNIKNFKEGDHQILVASSNLSEGLNLQEICRIEIFFSNSFSPVKREQAEGRIFRPGQKKQTKIIDLVCAGTLDEKLLEVLKEHKDMSEEFIEEQLFLELKRLQPPEKPRI